MRLSLYIIKITNIQKSFIFAQEIKVELLRKLFRVKSEMNNGYIDVMGIEENGEQNGNDDAINNAMPTMDRKVTIDRIRDERTNEETGEHEYLVKFKPVKEMWINSVDIEMFPELIQNYQKRKHNAPVYIDEEQQEEEDGSIDNESVDNRRHSSRQRAPTKRYVDEKEKPNKKKSTPHRKVSQSAKSAANQEDDDEDSDAEYTAEKILDKKVTKTGAEKYLVKWRGYGPEWNTWEPRKGIKHLKVFKKYEKKLQDGNDDEGEDEYTVEHIMERKVYKDGAIMYFIKWQGYDDTWNSWEPRDSLLHLDIVKKYEAENPMEEKEKVAKSKAKKGKKPGRKRSVGKQNDASTPTTSKKPRIEESTEKEKMKKKVMKKRKGTRRY